jgi:adenylate kinase family enzyme
VRLHPSEVRLSDFRRIAVRGPTGAGKTALANRIAKALGIPYVDMDGINHSPGWTESPPEKAEPILRAAVNQEAWVSDGNYRKWRHLTLPRMQLAIFLDFPFPLVFWRIFKRTVRRSWTKVEVWPGCRETFGKAFLTRDSILWWFLTTFHRRRRQISEFAADPAWGHVAMVVFRKPKELEEWLRENGVT